MTSTATEPHIHALGVGTGAPEDITVRALRLLEGADVVFTHVLGHGRQKLQLLGELVSPDKLRAFETPPRSDWLGFLAAFSECALTIEGLVREGRKVVFATLGDAGYTSYASFLDHYLAARGIGVRYVPGVSYSSAACAAIGDVVAEEGDRLTVLRCPQDLSTLDAHLALCDVLVLYTVPDMMALRDFVRARNLPYARVAVDLGRGNERYVELRRIGPKTPLGPAVVVLKTRARHMQSDGADLLNREGESHTRIAPDRRAYRSIDGHDLRMDVYRPPGTEDGVRPAILLFHGGGWKTGSPAALSRQCQYLASRGLVAMSAEYRIKSRFPEIDARHCVEDASAAFSWVQDSAAELGVDPTRVAIGGGSSGGHIAACVVLGLGPAAGARPTNRPIALVLLNPVTDLGEAGFRNEAVSGDSDDIDPTRHLRSGLPPTLILHGTDDRIVPYENSEQFCRRLRELQNQCTLIPYEGRGHAFFNHGRSEFDICLYETLDDIEGFLIQERLIPKA